MTRMSTFLAVTMLFAALLAAPTANAQSLALSPDSKLWIDGTSTRSDWTVHAKDLKAEASGLSDNGAPGELELTVAAAEITSDQSTIMDRLMHDALQVTAHPTITYKLLDAGPGSENKLETNGELTLAGVTKQVKLNVVGEKLDSGYRYTGSTPLKMTDYGLTPPTAMFGSLRTGDDVTIHFDVILVPAN